MSDAKSSAVANALFEIARAEGSLETVEDELFAMSQALQTNDELRTTLTDQALPVERRQGIVEDLLSGRALPVTVQLVSFVVGLGRAKDLPKIVDELVERAAQERQQAVAEVRTAIKLDETTQAKLVGALEKATDKKLSAKFVVDSTVLGGVVAQVGDVVIDGSVRHRLEQLKERI